MGARGTREDRQGAAMGCQRQPKRPATKGRRCQTRLQRQPEPRDPRPAPTAPQPQRPPGASAGGAPPAEPQP
eukprot:9718851-Alexandrium_andersonii.AAC.1